MSENPRKYGPPIPVRFDLEQARQIDALAGITSLSRGEIVRRACTAILPKFLTGEIPVVDVGQAATDREGCAS